MLRTCGTTNSAHNERFDHTERMIRLIWVFAGRIAWFSVGFVHVTMLPNGPHCRRPPVVTITHACCMDFHSICMLYGFSFDISNALIDIDIVNG